MTTYRTGNAIGSADPRDLYDNAENLDEMVNSQDKAEHPDRLGVLRKTWHAIEEQADQQEAEFDADQADRVQRFNLLLANSGYEYLADYAAGIEITEYNQVVRDNAGELWRAAATTTLPYTTDGAGLPEGGAFVAVGDADIRNDLSNEPAIGKGALLVRGSVIYVDTIADLQALDTSGLVDGQQFSVQGSLYKWSSGSTSEADGRRVVAPTGGAAGRWTLQLGAIAFPDLTVRVPSDFSTISDAIRDTAGIILARNTKIIILLESGFVPTTTTTLFDGNYGRYAIRSEDSTVACNVSGDLFQFIRCVSPRIECLFDMQSTGQSGIRQDFGSDVYVGEGCGVINAGNMGWRVFSNCTVSGRFSNFSNAGQDGLFFEQGCSGDVEGADFSGAARFGIIANHASQLCARLVNATNCGTYGVYSRHKSNVTFWGGDATGAGSDDLHVEFGGEIDAGEATYSANKINVRINDVSADGRIVDVTRSSLLDSGDWTPVLVGSTGSSDHSYSRQSGQWYRNGRTVTLVCDLTVDEIDAAISGQVSIQGLPAMTILGETSGVAGDMRNFDFPGDAEQVGILRAREESGVNKVDLRYARQTSGEFGFVGFPASSLRDGFRVSFSISVIISHSGANSFDMA